MKYMGMPWGMWTLFAGSFQAQLTDVLGYNEQTAKAITRRAKAKYKEILSCRPEFDGHLVDFDAAMERAALYKDFEREADCNLLRQEVQD